MALPACEYVQFNRLCRLLVLSFHMHSVHNTIRRIDYIPITNTKEHQAQFQNPNRTKTKIQYLIITAIRQAEPRAHTHSHCMHIQPDTAPTIRVACTIVHFHYKLHLMNHTTFTLNIPFIDYPFCIEYMHGNGSTHFHL